MSDAQEKSTTRAPTGPDVNLARAFATAAIHALRDQCKSTLTVGSPTLQLRPQPSAVDIGGFLVGGSRSGEMAMALCFPRATFLALMKNMLGVESQLLDTAVRDGAAELLNIIYGEVKTALNQQSYGLDMATPEVLLSDAALERLQWMSQAILIPFQSNFGPFFAQVGVFSRPEERKIATAPSGKQIAAMPFSPMSRILVVDDMSTMRSYVRRMLEGWGLTLVQEAKNGREGWEQILNAQRDKNPYDLVLSDWNMPEMSGLDLLREVRSHIALRNTPFVLITAESEVHQIAAAGQLRASGYLVKPVKSDGLFEKLVALLPKKK